VSRPLRPLAGSACVWLVSLGWLGTLAACSRPAPPPSAAAAPAAAAARPNVLLITVDTLRADHLSSWGYGRETSPTIDRLAAEGVRFASAWAQWPKTGPSFASLFSATYPKDNGNVRQVGIPLSCRLTLLAEVLRRSGYATRAVVANGALAREYRFDQGFDDYLEVWKGVDELSRIDKTRATRVTDLALASAGSLPADRPWFLWVHYIDPHAPYAPPAPYAERFQGDAAFGDGGRELRVFPRRRQEMAGVGRGQILDGQTRLGFYVARYDAEIAYADAEIGRLLAGLGAAGRLDDTVTAFTSDHGESLGEHEYYFNHGRFAFETCLHVPLVVHWPGRLAPRVDAAPAALVDLAPTLLDLAGVPLDGGRWAQGRSLRERLEGRAPEAPAPVFAEGGTASERQWLKTVRDGRWKFVHAPLEGEQRWIAGRGRAFVLYDLEADPGETTDVAAAHPEVAERLKRELWRWWNAPRHACETDAETCADDRPVEDETTRQLEALGYL
jgi:arylsulfatase A-like enzyme